MTIPERSMNSDNDQCVLHEIKPADQKGEISIENITKAFDNRKIIDNISISITANEIVGLVGPTGCGKTTLLNIIAGFEKPTKGKVIVRSERVTSPGPDRGFVFQQPNLFPWLTLLENVIFGLQYGRGIRGRPKASREIKAKAKEYLEWAGLGYAKDLHPYQVSGGMKARTALGRVLLTNPPILLMDEPFGALDALTRAAMHKFMLKLRQREKRTIILITHDVEEAVLLADRVFVMSIGPAHITRELSVPFGQNREYDELLRTPLLTDLKAELLGELDPYLGVN